MASSSFSIPERNRPGWLHLSWLLFGLTACTPTPDADGRQVIRSASAFVQGGKLYAQAALDPGYLSELVPLLRHGEPIVADYRFRFYRINDWLPDSRLIQVSVKRRLQMHLITEHFEMLDISNGQTHYAGDPDEAMGFIGQPDYVPLSSRFRMIPGRRYRLETHLELEHGGMFGSNRLLNSWISSGHGGYFLLHSPFGPS